MVIKIFDILSKIADTIILLTFLSNNLKIIARGIRVLFFILASIFISCLVTILFILSGNRNHNISVSGSGLAPLSSIPTSPPSVLQIYPEQIIGPENMQRLAQLACWDNPEYSTADRLTFSPDGQMIASSHNDVNRNYIIKLRKIQDGKVVNIINAHRGNITGLAFMPNGSVLLSSSEDDTIRVWDVLTGERLHSIARYELRSKNIIDRSIVSLPKDNDTIAIIYSDGHVRLWNIKSGRFSRLFRGDDDPVSSLAFSSDGRLIATGSYDGAVHLWDAQSRQLLLTLRGHTNRVTSIAFSSDGRLLASGAIGVVNLWDTQTGRLLYSRDLRSTVGSVYLSPDGQRMITSSSWGGTRVWDVASDQPPQRFTATNAVPSPDGRMLALVTYNRTIELWDINTNQKLRSFDGYGEHESITVVFSVDGERLASASTGGDVKLWDIQTSQVIHTFRGDRGSQVSLDFTSDGHRLVFATQEGHLKVWDTETGQLIRSIDGHNDDIRSIALSPSGRVLASASNDNTVKLWDTRTFQIIQTIKLQSYFVAPRVAFSPQERILALAFGKTVDLWDTQSNQVIRSLEGYSDRIYDVAFSPDGSALAVVSGQGIHFYDTNAWAEFRLISTDARGGIVFSPDGQIIVSISQNSTVNVWNIRNGVLLYSPEQPSVRITFAPDGRLLAAGTVNGKICLWGIPDLK